MKGIAVRNEVKEVRGECVVGVMRIRAFTLR